MKLLTTVTATIVLGLGMASTTHVKSLVYFNTPVSWAGTGCNANTVSSSGINTDSLKIVFESYDAGKNSQSGFKRTACSFSIPITLHRGHQISEVMTTWKGYIVGKGEMSSKYYLTGQPYTSWKRSTYREPIGGTFTKRDRINHSSFTTDCNGGRYNLRINSQIRAIGKNSLITLSTVNLPSVMKLSIRFKTCG